MLAPYGHLVSTVLHQKHIYREYVGLDACAADLMRPAMYGAYHHITVLGKEDAILDHVYDVIGGLCENNDKFAIERSLPQINVGDIVVKENGSFQLIRRAETPMDYFATLDMTEFQFHN